MKSPLRSIAWLLPLLLTGCFGLPFHKKQSLQARMLAPRIQPSLAIQLLDIELIANLQSPFSRCEQLARRHRLKQALDAGD